MINNEHKDYRVWVYNRIDGEMLSQIVDGPTAQELYKAGWKMSPAEFTEDPALLDNPQFEALADDAAHLMNFLLNVDKCDDFERLKEFAEGFMKLKVHHRATVKSLRVNILRKADELGLTEDASNS